MRSISAAGRSRARLDGRSRVLLLVAAVVLAVSLLTRLALLADHRALAADGAAATLAALAVGEGYDLVVALWLVLPLALYLALLPERWYRARLQQAVLWTGVGGLVYGLLFVAAAEWFFFQEFSGRFNFVAVDYLLYPHEVLTNIWESYPTGWILAGLGGLTAALVALLRRLAPPGPPAPAARRAAVSAALLLGLAGGTWMVAPGWGEVSPDRVLDEVARNGIYTFFAALRGSHASFQGLYATLPEREVFARLRRLLVEPATSPGSFARASTLRRVDNPAPARPLNVVVVLEESLGSEFVGVLRRGRERTLTPHLDRLAAGGTLLTRAYSTGNRTIRALEATTSGLPPLPGISVVRRPQSRDLFTLPALLRERGYRTLFVYGGRALFDGMGGYLRRNGVERVVEQSDFPRDTFATAWGVADEAIFDRALAEMDAMAAAGRPFYSLVLTVTNHRPFAFPADHVRRDPRLDGRQNAVRYADWALGRFMAAARRRAWSRETLFVLMGDHGARVYGAARLPLGSYEVPILFLGPGVARGRRLDTLASSLDVPPTLLGLLGLDYDSKFFGQDVFRVPPGRGRALMTHNSDVALLRGTRLAVLGLHRAAAVYDCDLAAIACRQLGPAGPSARELIGDAIAYYDGADRLYRSGAYGLREAPAPAAAAGAALAAAPGIHDPGSGG
jgi:hypothetical protein